MTFPAPSYSRPTIVTAPAVPSGTTYGPSGHGSLIEKYGPTVCEGVNPVTVLCPYSKTLLFEGSSYSNTLLFEHRRAAAAQHDVPVVAERPFRLGQVDVEAGDEPLPGLLVRHRVEDGVQRQQRVAGEVHLGDQPLGERAAEQREVNVGRTPGVVVVAPRVGARLDGDEPVPPGRVGDGTH